MKLKNDLPISCGYRKGAPFETVTEAVLAISAGNHIFERDKLQNAGCAQNWTIRMIADLVAKRSIFHAIKGQ